MQRGKEEGQTDTSRVKEISLSAALSSSLLSLSKAQILCTEQKCFCLYSKDVLEAIFLLLPLFLPSSYNLPACTLLL